MGLSKIKPKGDARPLGMPKAWQKIVDTQNAASVKSAQQPIPAAQEIIMQTLTLKGTSKNGKNALYNGTSHVHRFPIASFVGGTAPHQIHVADGTFLAGKVAKRKLSKEERAALPKPTLAEKIARREAALAKMKAQLHADM